LDEDELQPGIPWQQMLEAGIKHSKSVAVLVGKDGLGPWEDEEMQAALVLAVKDKRPCIPVLLPGASSKPDLPMFLGNRTWVDLRAGFTKDGLAKVVWGITGKKPDRIQFDHSPPVGEPAPRISPTRLSVTGKKFVGRQPELRMLDNAWNSAGNQKINIVSLIGQGGEGKSAIALEWYTRRVRGGWQGAKRVFDWSFYSQGTTAQSSASADDFFNAAFDWFGYAEEVPKDPWAKGAKLSEIIGAERSAITVHRLGQSGTVAAASSPVALRLPAYDVNVFVVERLHR